MRHDNERQLTTTEHQRTSAHHAIAFAVVLQEVVKRIPQGLAADRLDQSHALRRGSWRPDTVAVALGITDNSDARHFESQDWIEPFGAARP